MGFGSLPYTKVDYARTLAATFAYFLATQRDAVGLLTFHQEIADYLPARFRPGHLHRLLVCLENAVAGESTDLARPMEHIAELVTKRGLDRTDFRPSGSHRPSCGTPLVLTFAGPRSGRDARAGPRRTRFHVYRRVHVRRSGKWTTHVCRPARNPRRLLAAFREHGAVLQEICGGLGIELCEFATDRPLEMALFDFMQARMRRGQTVARRQSLAGFSAD